MLLVYQGFFYCKKITFIVDFFEELVFGFCFRMENLVYMWLRIDFEDFEYYLFFLILIVCCSFVSNFVFSVYLNFFYLEFLIIYKFYYDFGYLLGFWYVFIDNFIIFVGLIIQCYLRCCNILCIEFGLWSIQILVIIQVQKFRIFVNLNKLFSF